MLQVLYSGDTRELELSGTREGLLTGRVGISIVTEARLLRIRGGREALDLLADNLEGFASEADASGHCHVDSPTYDYIAPESDPLVIAFIK